MGKFTLASKLADEFAVSFEEAARFIDDVGLDAARSAADDALAAGSRTVSDWWKPATAGGALIGGGALAWRQQDIEAAKQIASQQQDYSSALEAIMASDLSPEAKRELVSNLQESAPSSGGGGGGDDGGASGIVPDDPATLVVLVIVLVMVLRYSLGGDA